MSDSELYNKKFELIDKNHVLIGCHRCRNTGTISAFKVVEFFAGFEKEYHKKSCDICGGQGEIRIKVPTITKDSPVQIFTCNECKGSGLSGKRAIEAKDGYRYPDLCSKCKGKCILTKL
jgi:DnaJ-class molecular chaperone|tara:strand:+ start:559 stop:915 length:357 start_codon:yes stop_codon:yes gene_type:complete